MPIHQGIADARHVGRALRGARAQIAGVGHAIRMRIQGCEDSKFRLRQPVGADFLFEQSPHFAPEMQQDPAQQDAGDRHLRHSHTQGLEVCLQQFEQELAIHLHTNDSMLYLSWRNYRLSNESTKRWGVLPLRARRVASGATLELRHASGNWLGPRPGYGEAPAVGSRRPAVSQAVRAE